MMYGVGGRHIRKLNAMQQMKVHARLQKDHRRRCKKACLCKMILDIHYNLTLDIRCK